MAWIAFQLHTGIVLEDALITFRFAENLATGRGFAFNAGEPVLGTTTPAFTLLLAALARLFGVAAIPVLAHVLLIGFAAVAVGCTARALRVAGCGEAAAAIAAFAIAFHPDVLWSTAGGMETMFVVALMAASFETLARGRTVATGALVGVLVLARPDGIVWAGLALAATMAAGARAGLRAALACVGVLTPWTAWATWMFGNPLPQSMLAKAVTVGPVDPLRLIRPSALRAALAWGAEWLPYPPGPGLAGPGFVVGLVAVVAGAWCLVRPPRVPARVVVALFPLALALAYHVGAAPRAFPWYGVPATWALLVAGAVGAGVAFETVRARPPAASAWIAAGALAAGVAVAAAGVEVSRTIAYEKAFQENEIATRRVIGTWIDGHAAPGAIVAMEAIGYQGTYARRRIIDLAGLVTPEVTRLRRVSRSNAEVYRRVFADMRPGYIVLRSFEVDENRHRDGGPFFENAAAESAFRRSYVEVARRTAPHPRLWGGGASLTIYEFQSAHSGEAVP